jgi:hypothetical protein
LLFAAASDLTVDEPATRAFGAAMYSEAECANHRQRYCENKDTRVGFSAAPFYIYDFGDELRVIYKTADCGSVSYFTYKDISSKSKLKDIFLEIRCTRRKSEGTNSSITSLDDIYAATRFMKTRAAVFFGPLNKRCKVVRSRSGYPLGTKCPRE